MKKYSNFSNALTQKETTQGIVWLIISVAALPTVLQFANSLLPDPMPDVLLNFTYYCINFVAVLWIFHGFLHDSMKAALRTPFAVLWYSILGYLGSQALGEILLAVILMIYPGFSNVNDSSIISMLSDDFYLMAIATVALVPVAEEVLYRGVLFRGMYSRNSTAAYLTSMGVFAAIHVMGYIGTYGPLHLLLCFIQYLPAGFCLCWCYRQTGTIISPILMHTIVNAVSVSHIAR